MGGGLTTAMRIDAGVDWSAPWLDAIREIGMEIAAADDWRLALNAHASRLGLSTRLGHPLRFIPQEELPVGVAYEEHIGLTGQVPTRENLHDFFNAMVWLSFPLTKVGLNALQAAQIAHLGIGHSRGSARDAATLFDENAGLLAVEESVEGHALVEYLRTHQWNALFVQEREALWKKANVFLFGHALMDKLVRPYKAITAHTLVCWVDPKFFTLSNPEQRAVLDVQLSEKLALQLMQFQNASDLSSSSSLQPSSFTPLPVLGVPGWWSHQDAAFYADVAVFRPMRQPR